MSHPHTHTHDHAPAVVVHPHYVPDHDHEHDDDALPLEDDPVWRSDNVVLHSVGVDIGSSSTQVVFSRLHLRRIGEDLSTRYVVVEREAVHRAPVVLTPWQGTDHIDAAALGSLMDHAYAAAGLRPEEVDTGVVILTGEALRRVNAQAIAEVLAARGGELVTATAGHHMEAMLAAYGSGAALASHEQGTRVLTVDVGGGTTKLALVEQGRVVATAAVHVGGRLVVTGPDGRIERLEPAGRAHAARAGLEWAVGATPSAADLAAVAASMADVLVDVLAAVEQGPGALGPAARELLLTDPLPAAGPLDGLVFSGGVAEYVHRREERTFGDLGALLGAELRARLDDGRVQQTLLPAGECIRATVLGASEYSVQLSGNTGWVPDPERLLPRRDLQVVHPVVELGEVVDADEVAAAVRRQLVVLDTRAHSGEVVLALSFRGLPTHARLHAFARGVRDGLAERTAAGHAVYLVLDGDVAMTVGRLLRDELGVDGDLLVLDGLQLRDFDYVDLGRVRHPSRTVPVTIKSLLFALDPRDAA